jgi:glycosyltransferase involved in cell wall biosynthesis
MYGVSKSKIKILYKGIDIKNYNFRLREKFEDTIEILFVKGGFENGGFYELVEAIILLKEYKIKLTIVGPRLIDLDIINNHLIEKGLTNYELNGPMQPEKVKTYFEQADIFCVPSHKEALGVANMEALASGIPVISTNVGGIPEVLDHGKCGWLVEPGNQEQLAKAIKDCIDNPKNRIEKSEYGYEFVQRFNSDNLISNFLKIMDEVVEIGSQK